MSTYMRVYRKIGILRVRKKLKVYEFCLFTKVDIDTEEKNYKTVGTFYFAHDFNIS